MAESHEWSSCEVCKSISWRRIEFVRWKYNDLYNKNRRRQFLRHSFFKEIELLNFLEFLAKTIFSGMPKILCLLLILYIRFEIGQWYSTFGITGGISGCSARKFANYLWNWIAGKVAVGNLRTISFSCLLKSVLKRYNGL